MQDIKELEKMLTQTLYTKRDIINLLNCTSLKPSQFSIIGNSDDIWSDILSEAQKQNKIAEITQAFVIVFPPAENRLIELGFLNNPSIMNSSQKELCNRFKAAVTTDSVTNELACDTLSLLDNLIQRSQDSDKKHLKAQAQLTDMAIIIHQLRDISVRINDLPKS